MPVSLGAMVANARRVASTSDGTALDEGDPTIRQDRASLLGGSIEQRRQFCP
jgi:hypothetical protein